MADDPAFDDYNDFLAVSVARYWKRKGSSKVTFLALMFATRHAWPVAAKQGLSLQSGKKALTGAAGLAAAAVLIRVFLGGPIGLLLAGASAVSLLAVYGKNQEAVWKKVFRFRGLIDDYEPKFDGLVAQHESGAINDEQKQLMVEGLMARFLDQLDETPPEEEDEDEEEEEEDEESAGSFASHVSRQEDD